jgi:hypothetical protein
MGDACNVGAAQRFCILLEKLAESGHLSTPSRYAPTGCCLIERARNTMDDFIMALNPAV